MRKKIRFWNILYHAVALLGCAVMFYPLLWMLMSSFKDTNTIFNTANELIPRMFTLVNYKNGWKGFAGYTFGTFLKNSCLIAITATVGAVLSSSLVAYGFARCRFKGRKFLYGCMMVTMMLPFQVSMIPQFLWYKKLGIVGTYIPLILPYFCGSGFYIFQMVEFLTGIPKELDEAAKLDGCSFYGIYLRIMLPLLKTALVTCAIFSFISRWDDFMGPLLFINRTDMYPVSYALKLFCDPTSGSDYGAMFAMSVISLVPAVLLFLVMQKHIVEGISTSGIKG